MIAVLTILALAVLWYVWARGRRQAQSGHVYFLHAVKVYALTGDEDARMAALAAGRLASARQRALMLDFLNKCSSELDQEKADCYARLCKHLKDDQTCYKTKCRNDWSKPDPRSTANLDN